MSKSKARFLAELLSSDGKVIKTKSEASTIIVSDLPTIPNSKLANSSVTIAGEGLSLGASLTLDTADITEHTNYKYYTDARAITAVSGSDLDMSGRKVLFGNMYSSTGDLPSASTYHGMFAHVHGTGKGYFAHAGSWVELANQSGLTTATNTASAALPKAGGAMTGAITTNSTFDGVDIATRDAVLTSTTTTANAALPKAGGTMTGAITNTSYGSQLATTSFIQNALISTLANSSGALIRMAVSADSNPTYSFEDDTNTGMFTSGADTLNFTTGGTERMRIDSSGNLTIGTVTSSTALTSGSQYKIKTGQQYWNGTKGTDGSIKLELYSTSSSDTYGLGVSSFELELQSAADIGFYAGGGSTRTKRMHIEGSNGNVGIGTDAPNTNVQVLHATDDTSININTGTGGSYPKKTGISFGATSTSLGGNATFTGGAGIQAINTAASGNPTNLVFWTNSTGTPAEAMRITSTGEIVTGGLTSSTGQLHLYKADATGGKLVLQSQVASDATAKISMMSRLLDNSNKTAFIEAYRGNLFLGGESGYGKVGIGTASPSERLHIHDGGIYTTPVTYAANQDDWALKIGASNNAGWDFAGIKLRVNSGGNPRMSLMGAGEVEAVSIVGGTVGIGTITPYGKLELKGSGNQWATAPAIRMWDDTNSKGWFVGTANNVTPGDFYIRTLPSISTNPGTSNQEFTIQHGTGNVGIGTSSPQNSAKVDIYSSATADHFNGLQIRRPNSTGITSAMQFTLANDIMVGKIQHDYVASNHNDMSFHLRLSGGSNQEVMRFYSGPINGTRVGIGVTVPTAKLHVAGTLLVTDVATINRANSSVNPPNTSDHSLGTRIELYNSSATAWYALGIESNTMWFQSDGNYKFYVDAVSKVDFDDSGVVNAVGGYKVNGTTAIDSNGIVAHVGTTAPSSPSAGKMWFDTTSGVAAMNVYNGAAWDRMSNKLAATGGTVTAAGGYKYHTFTSSGTFTAESAGNVDILVVGGGGAAGWYVGGGGGAGGMIESTSVAVTAQGYSIVIGAGASLTSHVQTSPSGSNTTAIGLTAIGGGGGGTYPNYAGANGGSGGGSGGPSAGNGQVASSAGTSGQGNRGGTSLAGRSGNPTTGSGGGGANGAGSDYPGNGSTARTTDGGAGKVSTICPDGYYYAGGGGGGAYNAGSTVYAGFGGIGGGGGGAAFATGVGSGGGSARNTGGTGASGNDANGGSGGQNTGGGSGGGGHYMVSGNNGGSGIVIIRYPI